MTPDAAKELLIAEGDRLTARLAQLLPVPLEGQDRLRFVARSLALNFVQVLIMTAEDVSRRAGRALTAQLVSDDRGRPVVQLSGALGETRGRLPVDDLLEAAFFQRSRLRFQLQPLLLEAVHAPNEHQSTRALVRCLRSPVLLETVRTSLAPFLR